VKLTDILGTKKKIIERKINELKQKLRAGT
jgi:hypothetical protein